MLTRIRKSLENKDGGFTLIELLVVMIIIGILAAIAIPVFLNQRKKAVDTSMKSDLRTVANEQETNFTDNQNYVAVTSSGTPPTIVVGSDTVRLSTGNTVATEMLSALGVKITTGTAAGYCSLATNANGTHAWVYNSLAGGLQPASVVVCP
jgi:type IV pilus assembly protein PilA